MGNYLSLKLTRNELEEVRVALEVQMSARREDIGSEQERREYDSLESAHRKVVTRVAAFPES